MKHYTDTIPLPLAEKLKEKGMPTPKQILCNFIPSYENEKEEYTFGLCFDWLLKKGIHIRIESDWDIETQIVTKLACGFYIEKVGMRPIYVDCPTWHEAAEKAIEKALTLI